VSKQGRIYVFYTKDIGIHDFDSQTTGTMGCVYSDDDGHSWISGSDIPMERNRYDHPDPEVPRNWIVWQKPIRDSRGRWMVGYTQWSSRAVYDFPKDGWYSKDSRALFMRFNNIDEGPNPEQLSITWLPRDNEAQHNEAKHNDALNNEANHSEGQYNEAMHSEGLEVPLPGKPEVSVAQEPSIVLLPDDRLFCVMRTYTGYIWYSISDDDGESWSNPDMLRYQDDGEPIRQPIASCPIFPLLDGRYVLVFHNNDGHLGEYGPQHALYNRRPAYLSTGHYMKEAHQPIWFSEPKQFLDTDGVAIGPKGTNEIATYPSLTEFKGKTVLWYPDRKYYLLGKYMTEDWLEG
jgi:hypothetical protein